MRHADLGPSLPEFAFPWRYKLDKRLRTILEETLGQLLWRDMPANRLRFVPNILNGSLVTRVSFTYCRRILPSRMVSHAHWVDPL